ncbi:hypothetical protein [Cryobacterium sp. Sr3]|uniref:hypothetical protein n=1 Tax=Cryobacterium sp. Sr3 TaxID=1259194 RepID=UPI00106C2097|nr:hypothetical protein [Cryobacterium sp. Sr3]TFB59139.1 hypothetical protein E3N94_03835 [Cryobacterium sp. Sr3]
MARHEKIKKTVKNYLAGLPDAEDRAEAAYQISQAYADLLSELTDAGNSLDGEEANWAWANDEALQATIRAAAHKRDRVATMDPTDASVKEVLGNQVLRQPKKS